MQDKIREAILQLVELTKDSVDSNDALKFSQAAVNLANAYVAFKTNT